jgi:hypothetical protein
MQNHNSTMVLIISEHTVISYMRLLEFGKVVKF